MFHFNSEKNTNFLCQLHSTNNKSMPIKLFRLFSNICIYSIFFGLESRFFFMESSTHFNWIIEKGVFQALQLAFFYEMGQVSPKNDANLYKDFKSSSGVGLRIVFSSLVLRADIATGEEGSERTVFVGYGF